MVGRQLKNRLLGTAILTLIGVIVFPYVFDGRKEHYLEGTTTIPLKPYESNEATAPSDLISSSVKQKSRPLEYLPALSLNNEVPVVEEAVHQYKSGAWVIQLVALKDKEKAGRLLTLLKEKGYKAHTKSVGGFNRVIIGPDLLKSTVERQLDELQTLTGEKGLILRFDPLTQ